MDGLLSALIPFAQDQLGKRGSFLPFGAALEASGSVRLVMSNSDDANGAIAILTEQLSQGAAAGAIRAAGVCVDATPREPVQTDAIQVSLEHADADPVTVYLPYRKRRLRGVEFGEIIGSRGERRIFPETPG